MTQGFYEQLGLPADAPNDAVRDAYHRQVARLVKRTRQLHEQGGDTAPLDLSRAQLDEAWAVLSVPTRRQRYDAMLRFLDTDRSGIDTSGLWKEVGASLVPPSVAAAAALLKRATQLAVPVVGRSPEIHLTPRPAPADPGTQPTLAPSTAVDATEATETAALPIGKPPVVGVPRPRAVSRVTPEPSPAPVAHLQAVDPAAPRPAARLVSPEEGARADFKLVEGTARGSSVIVLPADAPRQKTLTPDEVNRLTDIHGYSGGLIRAVREAKGVTLQEVASSTHISVRYLEALENDAHDRLPTATFVKGYVREVARLLKLDEEAVVRGYMQRVQ
jgi:hypothetical protein